MSPRAQSKQSGASGSRRRRELAGIGFRVRTGNATAVMLGGPASSPRFLARLYIPLVDMDDREARQPYHIVTEEDEVRGMILVKQTLKTATANAARATRDLIDRAMKRDHEVHTAVLVIGSDTDPSSIRQPHVHAHAMEGRLYREAVEGAISQLGLASRVIVERDALGTAEKTLSKPRAELKAASNAFGELAGRPWRLQDKTAALAAWIALDLR